MKKRRHYPGEANRIISLRMHGYRPDQIAVLTNRTCNSINVMLSSEKKRRGLTYPKIPRKDKKWTMEIIEKMAKQWYNTTYRYLGSQHHVSAPRIAFLMKQRAIGLREGTWTL